MPLGDMARVYYQLGDVAHAVECMRQQSEGVEQTVSFNLIVGSEHERLAYIDKYSDVINSIISLNVSQQSMRQKAKAATSSMSSRGIMASSGRNWAPNARLTRQCEPSERHCRIPPRPIHENSRDCWTNESSVRFVNCPSARRWIISPDGQLNFVPFEALVEVSGHFLLASQSICYVITGRDLLRMQVTNPSRSSPLLIANPLFGEPSRQIASSGSPNTRSIASMGPRRNATVASDRSDIYFAPLIGSTQEAKRLHILFPGARVLSGSRVSKAELIKVNAPEILHIATHGFFLNDIENSDALEDAAAATNQRGITAGVKVNNPLLRSGLALAGANLDSAGKDNGILTALEASNLDLWGTKLVTLSACDTGVGEVKNGEGVYGLRRAFILAGAQAIVTSLWSVSDFATRELMTDYYAGLKRGEGRGEALRKAKLTMFNRKGRAHPFYWASFIQIGNWTNLDGK